MGEDFLTKRLQGAVSYDRIAGYFCSSVLEIAGEAMEQVRDTVRIVCNSGLSPEDVRIAALAKQRMKQEWCAYQPEKVFSSPAESVRLRRLYALLSSGKLQIRVLPDEIYGLIHGKAGVITYDDGSATAFIGSMNETKSALTTNYEIVWEDDGAESVQWVHEEFSFFWNHPAAVPLCDFVISDIDRIAKRVPLTLQGWRERPEPDVAPVVVEEPVYRKESGLWAHQKYFVLRAFREHQTAAGARLLLADMVGLGKTLQLAMAAKLMALYGEKPVLIIAPKTLLFQWQEEIASMLDLPSAVWTGKSWKDESGLDYPLDILRCPRKIGIVSQGLITARSKNAERLLEQRYECVICDEAHRARRRNLNQDADQHKGTPNHLLAFLREISIQAHSVLLATATPVQVSAVEAYDLLDVLARGQNAENVMGDRYSVWRTQPRTGLQYTTGALPPPKSDSLMWSIVRNPFPPAMENRRSQRRISTLRAQWDIPSDCFVLPQNMLEEMPPFQKRKVRELYEDERFVRTCNPYVRCIVRRTRDYLESHINPETGEPYLKKIQVELYGERQEEALPLTGYLRQAYEIAEEFCAMLSKRVRGGGFMSTLLLRRIGSTMIAGESTARKMLSWSSHEDDTFLSADGTSLSFDEAPFPLSDEEEDAPDMEGNTEIRDLTAEETEYLRRLLSVLERNRATDPKYRRVQEILRSGVDNGGGWAEKGCIVFSQYFDSARYIADLLSRDMDLPIGLYAGGEKSGIYRQGNFERRSKDQLKAMVSERRVRVLVGTDSASEGLNLQMLSTLINVDLPWNPTRLEQRKGRIQRIGQFAETILIYNMRYKDSVEDKVHSKLSDRLKEIYDMFGQIPEVLQDVWIFMAQNDEKRAMEAIDKTPEQNPFVIQYEMEIPVYGDWGSCAEVLPREEQIRELAKGWQVKQNGKREI